MKKLVAALVALLRAGKDLNDITSELRSISEVRGYEKGSKEEQAVADYSAAASKMCNCIGKDLYEAALTEFKKLASNPSETAKVFGIKGEIKEADKVFAEIFAKTKKLVTDGASFEDDWSLWLSAADEVLFGTEPPKETSCICVCGGQLEKIPAELVGETSCEYVFKCPDCESYSLSDNEGNIIIGIAADKKTHELRKKAHTAVIKLCEEKGLSETEALRYISRSTKVSVTLKSLFDLEYLNQRECQEVVGYVLQRTIFDTSPKKYPRNFKEFMKFLNEGGRFKIHKSIVPSRLGRLMIPISVSENSITVKGKSCNERILMPSQLQYKFQGDLCSIEHPNNKETFKLFPKFDG